jgi:hypothetical protein
MKGDTISTDIISQLFAHDTCDTHLKVHVATPKTASRAVYLHPNHHYVN